jgi:hypothetical protein
MHLQDAESGGGHHADQGPQDERRSGIDVGADDAKKSQHRDVRNHHHQRAVAEFQEFDFQQVEHSPYSRVPRWFFDR